MTTRERLIGEIRELNPTASRDFLSLFDDAALGRYRDHLRHAEGPRSGTTAWSRPCDSRPVVCRTAAA